jgi:hypothetical protein
LIVMAMYCGSMIDRTSRIGLALHRSGFVNRCERIHG